MLMAMGAQVASLEVVTSIGGDGVVGVAPRHARSRDHRLSEIVQTDGCTLAACNMRLLALCTLVVGCQPQSSAGPRSRDGMGC